VVRDQRQRAYRLGYKVLTLSPALPSGNEKTELGAACLRDTSAHTGETARVAFLEAFRTAAPQAAPSRALCKRAVCRAKSGGLRTRRPTELDASLSLCPLQIASAGQRAILLPAPQSDRTSE
jgi:hypothetical protein